MTNPGSIPGQGNVFLGSRYRLIRQLGQGGFGYTYLAEDSHRFNELCVLKEFFPQVVGEAALEKAKQLFEREAGVLYRLQHPQIPRFRELLRTETGGKGRLFLVQDYVEGPTYHSLLDIRKRYGGAFSETEVTQLLFHLLPVLDYIHSIGVIHRDISPDNLILRNADGLPVLIDFGGVKQLAMSVGQQVGTESNAAVTRLGKIGYAPEEQLSHGMAGPSSDLYGLAVTALVLITGQSPEVLCDRNTLAWQWQEYADMSPRLAAVLQRMLAARPSDRYQSAAEVMQALNMPMPNRPASTMPLANMPPPDYGTPYGHQPSPPPQPTLAASPGVAYAPSQPSETVAYPVTPMSGSKRDSSGFLQAFVGLSLLIGAIGLVWWIAGRWEPIRQLGGGNSTATDQAGGNQGQTDGNTSNLSPEEQARKQQIRDRIQKLGVNDGFFVRLTDQLFYAENPDWQGRVLSDQPQDEPLRRQWDSIATGLLDTLEANLGTQARRSLGGYTQADLDRWQDQVNQLYVSSRALYDLTDAKFFQIFPSWQQGDQIDLEMPIGQVWYAIADDQVQAMTKGERRREIKFDSGAYSQQVKGTLDPGQGVVYVLNLSADQLMRVNLQANPGTTLLSIYLPNPSDAEPYILSKSGETAWAGTLTQSGYYELVVVSKAAEPIAYQLNVAVDNVTTTPKEPPAEPEAKN